MNYSFFFLQPRKQLQLFFYLKYEEVRSILFWILVKWQCEVIIYP